MIQAAAIARTNQCGLPGRPFRTIQAVNLARTAFYSRIGLRLENVGMWLEVACEAIEPLPGLAGITGQTIRDKRPAMTNEDPP